MRENTYFNQKSKCFFFFVGELHQRSCVFATAFQKHNAGHTKPIIRVNKAGQAYVCIVVVIILSNVKCDRCIFTTHNALWHRQKNAVL